jgi:hypothetical protein
MHTFLEGGNGMANNYGYLPKADRSELPDDLKKRLEVWHEKAYEDDNLFLTMAKRPDLLRLIFGFFGYTYAGTSRIEPELFELCRLRMAKNNECVH